VTLDALAVLFLVSGVVFFGLTMLSVPGTRRYTLNWLGLAVSAAALGGTVGWLL